MADKIGQGVIWEQPPSDEARQAAVDAKLEGLRKKRDDARWYIVAGIGLLFAGSFSIYFAMGGVFMAVYGTIVYFWMEWRIKQVDDPWDDEEIDAWERDNFG